MKQTMWVLTAVLALAVSVGAYAADPVATELDSADVSDYVGYWTLSMEFQGNPVEMGLTIVDLDGKIGATINSERMPEPVAVHEASADDSGITLTYDMDFGGNAFTIDIKAVLEDGNLVGTLGDQGGLFSAEIAGEKGTPPAPPVVIDPTELDTVDAADYVGTWAVSMEMMGNAVEMVPSMPLHPRLAYTRIVLLASGAAKASKSRIGMLLARCSVVPSGSASATV